jgi:cycloeucalenol cycloisomerase
VPDGGSSAEAERRFAYFADDAGKRAVERWWLLYTPVWGAATGVVMLGGFAERWGDLACLLFGIVLALGALVPPYLRAPACERARPFWDRAAVQLGLVVVLLAFGLNYTQTPFFWDVLHMHYGFQVTWTIENNPIFLYLVTVAYFATYAALMMATFRFMRAKLPPALSSSAYLLAPIAMAFLETALNANPFMKSLFCYDDLPLVLTFGSLAYGVAFVYALPVLLHVKEGMRMTALVAAAAMMGALYADLITLDVLRYHVAPQFTTVVPGADGLRDYEGSCLELPQHLKEEPR